MLEKVKALLRDCDKMREMSMYLLFGVLTTAVNWLVYFAFTSALGMNNYAKGSYEYVLIGNAANIVAWIAAVLFAFFTTKRFVIQSKRDAQNGAWKEFGLFVSARLLSLVLFEVLLYTLALYILPHEWDKLLMNVLVVVFNYFASSFVVFKKTQRK